MVQLAARARRTCEERPVEYPIYFEQATTFCLCFIISSTLQATRVPWASRAGVASNLGVELKADTSTFEYSHVPLHACTLRGVALMKLSFKPVRASRAAGFQGPYGGSQLVLTL